MPTRAEIKAKVRMDSSSVDKQLSKAERRARKFQNTTKAVGRSIGQAFAVGAIANFANEAVQLGSTLSDMAVGVGLNVETFQALSLAARDAGAQEGQLVNALARLKDAQGRVIEGDKTMIEAFQKLGLSAQDVVESDMEGLFTRVADGLTKSGNSALEFSAVAELIGTRNAPRLVEALNRVSEEGFDKLSASAKASGQVIDEDTIKRLDELADQLNRTKRTILLFFGSIIDKAVRATEAVSTFVGALSAMGLRETIRQVKSGELLPDAESDKNGEGKEAEKEELLRQTRIAQFQANLDKKRTDQLEKDSKKTAGKVAGVSGPKVTDALRAIGAGGVVLGDPIAKATLENQQQQLAVMQNQLSATMKLVGITEEASEVTS